MVLFRDHQTEQSLQRLCRWHVVLARSRRAVAFLDRPAVRQWESPREVIRVKNEFYFHRFRPQNETYLYLFRQHEQGNNAVGISQFDGLVSKRDRRSADLWVPRPYRFELRREADSRLE